MVANLVASELEASESVLVVSASDLVASGDHASVHFDLLAMAKDLRPSLTDPRANFLLVQVLATAPSAVVVPCTVVAVAAVVVPAAEPSPACCHKVAACATQVEVVEKDVLQKVPAAAGQVGVVVQTVVLAVQLKVRVEEALEVELELVPLSKVSAASASVPNLPLSASSLPACFEFGQ